MFCKRVLTSQEEEMIDETQKNFVVDIMQCSKDKKYLTAYIHNAEGGKNYSFGITVVPGRLFYYGDVGVFTFNNFGTPMLDLFNAKEPNENYWHEKLDSGESTMYSSESVISSFLEELTNLFCLESEDFTQEDIDNGRYDKMRTIIENLPNGEYIDSKEDFLSDFDTFIELADEESNLSEIIDMWYDIFEDAEGLRDRDFTFRYLLCCRNLCKYSGLILEKADEFLQNNQ